MKKNLNEYKRNFFNTAIADIYRALNGGSYTGGFILSFCLIDNLTWIEFGEEKFNFDKWINKRLLPLNILYSGKASELYSVRNGLVHSYGPSNTITSGKFAGYQLMHCNPAFHLQRVNSQILRICLYSLLTETIFAAHLMFEEFKSLATTAQIDRMDQQITIAGSAVPHYYSEMHSALACFDGGEITLSHVRAGYTRFVLYPEQPTNITESRP